MCVVFSCSCRSSREPFKSSLTSDACFALTAQCQVKLGCEAKPYSVESHRIDLYDCTALKIAKTQGKPPQRPLKLQQDGINLVQTSIYPAKDHT